MNHLDRKIGWEEGIPLVASLVGFFSLIRLVTGIPLIYFAFAIWSTLIIKSFWNFVTTECLNTKPKGLNS